VLHGLRGEEGTGCLGVGLRQGQEALRHGAGIGLVHGRAPDEAHDAEDGKQKDRQSTSHDRLVPETAARETNRPNMPAIAQSS